MASKINSAIGSLLLVTVTLGACKVGKDYQRPDTGAPAQFRTITTSDTSSIANIEWKQFFTDTTLQGLIARGIANNYDLQLAIKRIGIANAQVQQAKQGQLPVVNLQATFQTTRPADSSLNGISTQAFLGKNHIEDYNFNLGLSWEADIWGKIRRQKEVALANYLQTYEAVKAVQTQLVAEIAQAYYNLLMLDAQLDITRRNLLLSDSTLQVTSLQRDAGDVTTLAVQQAQAQKQSISVLVPQLEQAIAIQENALSILLGENPGTINRSTTLTQITMPDNLPVGLPAEVVSRRPDVRQSEMALIAANAQVGVAEASRYPTLVISAQVGLDAFKASNWFKIPAGLFETAGAGLTQPLLNHRQLKTAVEIARIQREQSVIQFRQSVLNAVGEVSNALVEMDKLKQQQVITAAQVDTLHFAIRNASLLFKAGMANYLEVINAQSSVLQSELNLASIQRMQLSAVVDLYRSLGGGWK